MTFIQIQENIAKKFSNDKKLFFNTRNSSLYFNKKEELPYKRRNLQKLQKLFVTMADDYHNNNKLESYVDHAIQKTIKGGRKEKNKTKRIQYNRKS
jgi:hypothetical protein